MPLFLITSLYDEGISPNLFRVIEAESLIEIAAHILAHPEQWDYFLRRAFGEEFPIGILTPESLLERINRTYVDGDSSAQFRITPITAQSLDDLEITPAFRSGAMFSDFG